MNSLRKEVEELLEKDGWTVDRKLKYTYASKDGENERYRIGDRGLRKQKWMKSNGWTYVGKGKRQVVPLTGVKDYLKGRVVGTSMLAKTNPILSSPSLYASPKFDFEVDGKKYFKPEIQSEGFVTWREGGGIAVVDEGESKNHYHVFSEEEFDKHFDRVYIGLDKDSMEVVSIGTWPPVGSGGLLQRMKSGISRFAKTNPEKQLCDSCEESEPKYRVVVTDMEGNVLESGIFCRDCATKGGLESWATSVEKYLTRIKQ